MVAAIVNFDFIAMFLYDEAVTQEAQQQKEATTSAEDSLQIFRRMDCLRAAENSGAALIADCADGPAPDNRGKQDAHFPVPRELSPRQ